MTELFHPKMHLFELYVQNDNQLNGRILSDVGKAKLSGSLSFDYPLTNRIVGDFGIGVDFRSLSRHGLWTFGA